MLNTCHPLHAVLVAPELVLTQRALDELTGWRESLVNR